MNTITKFLTILLSLALIACGGGVRGQPPLVSVSSLWGGEEGLTASVNISNPNDVEMSLVRVAMTMTLDQVELAPANMAVDFDIHPHGTEEMNLLFQHDADAQSMLAELHSGARNGLPYSVKGEIRNRSGNAERFEHAGYFYPVPGKPGQYRGAGPQREAPRDN